MDSSMTLRFAVATALLNTFGGMQETAWDVAGDLIRERQPKEADDYRALFAACSTYEDVRVTTLMTGRHPVDLGGRG